MGGLDNLWERMQLEIFLGHNTECIQCGETFLAHEDGCPNCGAGARTRFIAETVRYEDCKPDRSPNGYRIFTFADGSSQMVGNDKFSHWLREMEIKDGIWLQMMFNKEDGEFYALDGSFSPWPREGDCA